MELRLYSEQEIRIVTGYKKNLRTIKLGGFKQKDMIQQFKYKEKK